MLPKWLRDLLNILIPPRKPPPPPPPPLGPTSLTELYRLLNAERAQAGLPALQRNGQVETAAMLHAQDMARRGIMTHVGSDGSTVGGRLTRTGYAWQACGEIIAEGSSLMSEAQVVALWMGDSPHRQEILWPAYLEFGGGESANYWCVDFGRR